MIHKNTLDAYSGTRTLRETREGAILRCLREHGAQTDREIMHNLGLPEPNCVRPRVNNLIAEGLAYEEGDTRCHWTGKTVRVVAAALCA